ncbi:glycosyltransferase family 4 protein [Methylobacterium segetis]|uniref:glycosyltransferase family 4 protein n=1 Tax=Methylobacterium segetis TaxID=2488750 RepID=UPI001051B7C1|nr:glycosyltransferase family 1 protein [Methylobacterium segetis]
MPKRFLIDITTSRHYIGKHAVGIVRTEREIAKEYLASEKRTEFFYYDHLNAEFRSIGREKACEILYQDPKQVPKRMDPQAGPRVQYGSKVNLQSGDVVVSAGLLWDFDYLSLLYTAKKRKNIFVAQVIYDIIPIVMPEYCVPGMDKKFPKFILDAAWTADILFCISDSTLRDVESYLARLETRQPALARMELGADVHPSSPRPTESWRSLASGRFVLYVSTIEPRKNHQMLFNIWRELHERAPGEVLPLVFVGRPGWNVENLLSCIEGCHRLFPDRIRILEDVSDEDLSWLYANARYTVYPSLYEGWGLPIAESLAAGTPCLASSSASMPEVAGDMAELLDPLDYAAWRDAIHRYTVDDDLVQARRARIASTYEPRKWEQVIPLFRRKLDAVLAERGF